MAKVLLVEPYYSGSHKLWADQFIQFSSHDIGLLSLPGKYWKWRMHGAAIELSKNVKNTYDLIFVSSMIDLALFKSLLSPLNKNTPIIIYFHENQLAYPWTDRKKEWDRIYAWKNYSSALVADQVCFSSQFNKNSFINNLSSFLSAFPDFKNLNSVQEISDKSIVLTPGLDLSFLDQFKFYPKNRTSVILWNHRWEHDKNPHLFFKALFQLKTEGIPFELIVLGQSFKENPSEFNLAKSVLKDNIIHWGYANSRESYIKLLWKADLLPVTSRHDFFGLSVIEATYCNTLPILPNRLAYPEHFDHSELFYHTDSEFYDCLKGELKNRRNFNVKWLEQIKKYDWNRIILQYDDLIYKLAN